MKAIFHIDERHKWALLASNIKNLLMAEKVTVAVVINSEAVELFKIGRASCRERV